MIKNKKSLLGLTLIEALIWFAIFASVVAGVFALYSQSRNSSNASTVNKELSTIFSQTEQLYASDDTASLTNTVALQLGIFPGSVKVKGAVVNNVFGGTITITGTTPSGFGVIYTNIPTGDVCSSIVRSQKSVGWDTATVGGTAVSYNSSYSIASVAAACKNAGGAAMSVTFTRLNANI
ncbi:TPA: type 4 pilus major pilin [Pseudomonas putida]